MPRSYPRELEADVALRDGSVVHIRPVRAEDEARLLAFLQALPDEDRLMRFFGLGNNLARTAHKEASVDYATSMGLVAAMGTSGEIVGHAMYVATGDDTAEVAFAIARAYQGIGLGTLMLGHLAQAASVHGIGTLKAVVLAENRRMIDVLRGSGFPTSVRYESNMIEVTFPAALKPATLAQFEHREALAAANALHRMLYPTSVAVIGAVGEPASVASAVMRNLRGSHFPGPIYAVNPIAASIELSSIYRSVEAIPGAVDLAIVAVSAPNIADVVEECGRKGVSTLVVLTAGFAETGAEGQQRQVDLLRTARTYGMRVVGPNCTGIINTDPDAPLNATFGPLMPPAGRVGMATQSAALGLAAVDFTSARNLGLSSLVSMGNKADISGNDLLGYWHTDPRTDAILLYLESFGNPRKFGRLARDIGRSKPIVALKSGRSSVGPRLSGLDAGGLLAASDISVDALFRQAGVIRTDTLQEMLDVAELLVHQPLPRGARVAILSNSSGPAIMCADTCEARGLEVAHAVDLTAAATAQHYADTLRTLTEDPNVDALISIFLPLLTTQAEDVAHALRAAAAELVAQKPVLAVFMSAHALPILTTAAGRLPGYQTPEAAAIALAHATTYALWRDRPPEEPPEFADLGSDAAALIIARALQRGAGWLGWDDVQRVLLLYGVETIDQGSASSRLEATVPGVEMLIGVVHDPQFGPTVACGAGGALAEVMNDVAIRLSPLTRNDAATMLRELRSFRLLEGYRGSTACDVSALEDVILRISAMVERHPEIAELDCNPVIVSAAGALVIDARIRVAPAPPVPPLGARRQ